MEKDQITAIIESIVENEPRYTVEAYFFISDAVSCAVRKLEVHRHVSARELLEAMRDFAVESFGAVAAEVLRGFGIRSASDVGEIVYILIRAGLLSSSPNDRREDFDIEFDFFPENPDLPPPDGLPVIDQDNK
ncbi:MAG: hypothetical protein PHI35_01195 [Victivallaceae bacterium]|nr:hypothetical protein [Victivallaceae bacterium]